MATAVLRIPKIGVTMTEATLAEWLAEDGTTVTEGDALYVLEMDKASNEIQAPISGRLEIVGVAEEVYQVGDLVGRIRGE